MKSIITLVGMFFMFALTAQAQFNGECSRDVLKCDFYKNTNEGQKSMLESSEKSFSPSLFVPACTLEVYSDVNYDDTMMITLNDRTNTVKISIVDRLDGPAYQRAGGASFKIQKGETFFFQYQDHLAVCRR